MKLVFYPLWCIIKEQGKGREGKGRAGLDGLFCTPPHPQPKQIGTGLLTQEREVLTFWGFPWVADGPEQS